MINPVKSFSQLTTLLIFYQFWWILERHGSETPKQLFLCHCLTNTNSFCPLILFTFTLCVVRSDSWVSQSCLFFLQSLEFIYPSWCRFWFLIRFMMGFLYFRVSESTVRRKILLLQRVVVRGPAELGADGVSGMVDTDWTKSSVLFWVGIWFVDSGGL